jgi:hypothetical protein
MLKHQRFADIESLNLFMQGAILTGPRKLWPVAGLTLTMLAPTLGTCTFVAGANPEGLTFKELKTQLETAITTVRVASHRDCLAIYEATLKTGAVIDATASAAICAVLGLVASGTITGTRIYGVNSGRVPRVVQLHADAGFYSMWWETENDGALGVSSKGTSIANPSAGNTVLSPPSRLIYVGGTGDLVVHRVGDADGTYTTYKAVPVGTMIPVHADEVRSSTTATFLVIDQ